MLCSSIYSSMMNYSKTCCLNILYCVAHGLVAQEFGSLGCSCSTPCQPRLLGDVQLVIGLEGPGQPNSHAWHLGPAQLGPLHGLLGFLTRPLSQVFVLLVSWLSSGVRESVSAEPGRSCSVYDLVSVDPEHLFSMSYWLSMCKTRFKQRRIRLSLSVRRAAKNLGPAFTLLC